MASPGGEGEGGSDRRYRSNMQGLLQFCVDSTRAEDAEGSSGAQEMDPERRQWLAEALSGMAGNDLVKQMAECLQVIQDSKNTDERLEALETLQDMCEDMDLAKDLHKIGGFDLFPTLLQDNGEDIRASACSLIATVVQNNLHCQTEALKMGLLSQLLDLLDKDDKMAVKVKALYAVSCSTRDVEESQTVFVENDGFSVLLRAMQGGDEKVQTKAAFMMKAMCMSKPQFKDVLCNMGMVEQLVALLQTEHTSAHEHLVAALLCLVDGNIKAIQECLRPELNLQNYLQSTKQIISNKEEFMEELDYIEQLQKILLEASPSSVDR